jgi:transposase
MKAYSQDLRARAIKLFDDGYERKHIKSILSISYDTLNDWIRRYERTGDYSSRQHLNKGFARKFTDKEAVLTCLVWGGCPNNFISFSLKHIRRFIKNIRFNSIPFYGSVKWCFHF